MNLSRQCSLSIAIDDRSAIGEARRMSAKVAEAARFGESRISDLQLVVTELATNLLVHAKQGEILLQLLPYGPNSGVEIIAIDHGPGIADLQSCMSDGYSKAGTRGSGLGAIKRLSDEFDIYTTQPEGTVIASRFFSEASPAEAARRFSAINVPISGEHESGDAWQFMHLKDGLAAVVIDGLGHGPLAALAAAEAVNTFNDREFDSPTGYLEAAHNAMRSTRGAAIAVAQADFHRHTLDYAGVGNISGSIFDRSGAKSRSLVSFEGIVGSKIRKLQQFEYQWANGDLLIMHSDGLAERWKLLNYPGLAQADVSVIAGVLYRDAKRGRDDVTVFVARLTES
jgi:anti-sigma regulatory factor (Ser/Thr protein kinase)